MKYRFFLIIGCLAFFSLFKVCADGMVLRPVFDEQTQTEKAYAEEETHQRAFLYYDWASKTERMIIEVRTGMFKGSYAWIIPLTPVSTEPVVQFEEIPAELNTFTQIDRATAPEVSLRTYYVGDYQPRGCVIGCADVLSAGRNVADETDETGQPEVVVWDSGETASFSFSHVSSQTVPDLVAWCSANGYGDLDGITQTVLLYYVERDWSFVLVQGTKNGASSAGCVSLTFSPAERPFFPLAISAPGHRSRMPIDLFVASMDYIEPSAGSAEFLVQAIISGEAGGVSTQLLKYGTDPWYGEVLYSGGIFQDAGAIPAAAEILERALASISLDMQREYEHGDESWWRFYSRSLTVDDESDAIWMSVRGFLSGLSLPSGLVFSRFQRSFDVRDELEDIFFDWRYRAVPFEAHIYAEASVYDPENAGQSAGPDLSLVFGLLIWVSVKTVGRMRHGRRGRVSGKLDAGAGR